MCRSRKYPCSPTEGIGIYWGVGGSVRPENLKKCVKALLEFLEGWGGGGLRKNPFRGGGMDIFWNYTIILREKNILVTVSVTHYYAI